MTNARYVGSTVYSLLPVPHAMHRNSRTLSVDLGSLARTNGLLRAVTRAPVQNPLCF